MRKLIPLCVLMFAVAFLEVSAQENAARPAASENVQAANAAADQALAEEEAMVEEGNGENSFLSGLGGWWICWIFSRWS